MKKPEAKKAAKRSPLNRRVAVAFFIAPK